MKHLPYIQTASRAVFVLGVFLWTLTCIPRVCWAQQSPRPRAAALCDSASAYLERGEVEEAYRLFGQALRLDRDFPHALLGMGRAMLEMPKGGGRALEYLKRAVALEPDNLKARYYKALAHILLSNTDVTTGNARLALEELEKILALNPSYPDAYYRRGMVLRDTYEDFEGAKEAFRNQIDADPQHTDARFALLELEMGVGGWEAAVDAAEAALARDPGHWEIYPYLAGAHWKAGRLDEAMHAFERFFAVAPEKERNLYFDLGLILTPAEGREFSRLDDVGRQTYWRHYWRSRDPVPKTPVNERLLEHFIRIAYARIEFSWGGWPWDARGEAYIRFGEPDIRTGPGRPYASELLTDDWEFYIKKRDLYWELGLGHPRYIMETALPETDMGPPGEEMPRMVDGSGTAERWIYTDRGLDLKFDNPVMSGRYLKTDGTSILVHAMELHIPSISEEEEKIETFVPLQSAVTFRGTGGKTVLEYAIGLLPDDFGMFRSPTGPYSYVDVQMELFTPDWQPVADAGSQVRSLPTTPQITIRGNPLFVHATRLEVEPGDYVLSTLLVDPEAGRQATADEEVTLPDYSGERLMLSDILPAARITEVVAGTRGRFVRGNLEVLPLPGRTLGSDQPLFVYFEIYNLTRDAVGATQYRVRYSVVESSESGALLSRLYQGLRSLIGWGQRRAVISSEFVRSGIRRDVFPHLEVDMSVSPAGLYELRVEVTDLVSGQRATSSMTFRTLPPAPER